MQSFVIINPALIANIQSEANVIFSKFLKETQVVSQTRSAVSEDSVTK